MLISPPVVVFIHRRPEHLKNTLLSLLKCDGIEHAPIFVYGDGARSEDEMKEVTQARNIAESILGNRAKYRYSKKNKGLSRSVIDGVTEVLMEFEEIIVLEDDLILERNFLLYMNKALKKYCKTENVYQISGYQFDVSEFKEKKEALFLPFTVSWGWGTWRRAWSQLEEDAEGWMNLKSDKRLRYSFNLDGTYEYSTMLFRQMKGSCDSWAIRWYWTVFKNKGLTLFPPKSLVGNSGFDGTGTNGTGIFRKFSKNGQHKYKIMEIEMPNDEKVIEGNFRFLKNTIRRENGFINNLLLNKIRWLLIK